jgi:hypothetical protein
MAMEPDTGCRKGIKTHLYGKLSGTNLLVTRKHRVSDEQQRKEKGGWGSFRPQLRSLEQKSLMIVSKTVV